MFSKNTAPHKLLNLYTRVLSVAVFLFAVPSAMATIVQFQTVMGDFQVNLYDKATPKTVENFLTYVKSGAYTNNIVHRSVPGFIVQGGGYKYENKLPLIQVAQNAAVINEPVYANKRGTIAMAKLGGSPNSATNQWFFNLADNSSNLDSQNSGFTPFGEVMGNGMAIVDAMAALNIFIFDSLAGLTEVPLRNYTSADAKNNVAVTDKNFVMILNVVVLDANIDTAANLNPAKTSYSPPSSGGGDSPPNNSSGGGGGGSVDFVGLLLLAALGALSFRRK